MVGQSIAIAEEGYESGLSSDRSARAGGVPVILARRSIRVVQDEFATPEERIRGLLSVPETERLAWDTQDIGIAVPN